MSAAAGWLAIALALIALAPSFVPGAFSALGLLISLVALMVSILSVKENGTKYFTIMMVIVLVTLLLVNDGLRIGQPLEMPISIKLTLYGIAGLVILVCIFIVAGLTAVRKPRDSSTQGVFPNE